MRQLAATHLSAPPVTGAARVAARFWPIATVLLIVRLLIDSSTNLVPDEAFYWTWTRHLAGGYFDHPPTVAWMIWLSTRVFGNTELGVRLPASVLSIASLAVLYEMARRILPDARAVGYVILMWIAGPLLPVVGTIVTPDVPAIFFSICALACAVKLADDDASATNAKTTNWKHQALLWSAFGICCGLAFLSKYTTVLVPAGVTLAFLTSRRNIRHFARPWIYLAGILSLLVFSPCIVWNYQHHWVSFAFQLNHGAGGGLTEGITSIPWKLIVRLGGLAEFVGGQALVWTPILFAMIVVLMLSNWVQAARNVWSRLRAGCLPLFDSSSSSSFSRHACVPCASGDVADERHTERHASVPTKLGDENRSPVSSTSKFARFVNLGKLQHLSERNWLLLWSGTFPLVFFGYAATRSHGEINWPAFAYFPLSLLLGRYLAENWQGIRVQWARKGCEVALGFTIVLHLLAFPGLQQWLLQHRVHLTHQITDLWGWNQFGRELALQSEGLPVVCNRHQDAGEAAFYMPGKPHVWCDGIGSRRTAFEFFTGQPDYAHIPEIAFVGGHVDLFKKEHGYPVTKAVNEVIIPGVGKNRSHIVTIVGRMESGQ